MAAFLDKIFGSKLEVDLAKIELEAELSFHDCQLDNFLAKRIIKKDVPLKTVERYESLLKRLVLLEEKTVLPIERELQLLTDYIALYENTANNDLFLRVDAKVETNKAIPPLLTFPLIANALQQGYNLMEKYPLKVKIRAFEKMLLLEVSNHVNPYIVSQEDTLLIGRYKNRLLSLFPDAHNLFFNSNGHTFKANLQLNW